MFENIKLSAPHEMSAAIQQELLAARASEEQNILDEALSHIRVCIIDAMRDGYSAVTIPHLKISQKVTDTLRQLGYEFYVAGHEGRKAYITFITIGWGDSH